MSHKAKRPVHASNPIWGKALVIIITDFIGLTVGTRPATPEPNAYSCCSTSFSFGCKRLWKSLSYAKPVSSVRNRACTAASPFSASLRCKRTFLNTVSSACARALSLSGGTRIPFLRFSIISGMPPAVVATIGFLQAMASTRTIPKGSDREGSTKTSHACRRFATWVLPCCPRKSTLSAIFKEAAISSNPDRNGPSPASTSRSSGSRSRTAQRHAAAHRFPSSRCASPRTEIYGD